VGANVERARRSWFGLEEELLKGGQEELPEWRREREKASVGRPRLPVERLLWAADNDDELARGELWSGVSNWSGLGRPSGAPPAWGRRRPNEAPPGEAVWGAD